MKRVTPSRRLRSLREAARWSGRREGLAAAAVGLERRTGMVGGEAELLEAGELGFPVGELLVEDVALEPGALPVGEIGVLDGEVGERGGFAGVEGVVEEGDFADEDVHGPGIGDDVVHGQEDDVLVGAEAEQGDAQEGAAAEVEGAVGLVGGEARDLGVAHGVVERGEIDDRDGEGEDGADVLDGAAGEAREGGAQDFVAADELGEGLLEDGVVERAGETNGLGAVVRGDAGFELVEKPEALLGERQREVVGARDREEGRSVKGDGAGEGALDAHGEAGDGRGLEEIAEWEVDVEELADAGDDLSGEEGMAAELEEVVVAADGVDGEDVLPDGGEELFGRGAWSGASGGGIGDGELGGGRARRSTLPWRERGRWSRRTKAAGIM